MRHFFSTNATPEIEGIITEMGGTVPSIGRYVCVEDDAGKLAAFLVVRVAVHAEPLWVRPDMRGKVNLHTVRDMAADIAGASECFVFVPNQRIRHLAESLGMQDTGWTVMRRRK